MRLEVRHEAQRLNQSISGTMALAWRMARPSIRAMEPDREPMTREEEVDAILRDAGVMPPLLNR
jgi:hypothetical protein